MPELSVDFNETDRAGRTLPVILHRMVVRGRVKHKFNSGLFKLPRYLLQEAGVRRLRLLEVKMQ